ncbi:MAG TPA: DUF2147 domain-containing protein [Gammaproteobacteria bacterium]|jgi:uncharacterized protein (DUF2147 family)|nr:DUF2147 domain-containing protein [Gammaproteobacteria bacterium]
MKYLIFFLSLISIAYADPSDNIEGFWKTYDLQNHPRTIIQFYRIHDEYRADIYEVLDNQNNPTCQHCRGENKDKLLKGMTIIHGLKFSNQEWQNGAVLDTDSGKTYDCKIQISENGKQMLFRAYIHTPMLGRTLKWERITV